MTRPREPEDKAGLHAVDVSDVLLHPLSPRERAAFTRTSSERALARYEARRAAPPTSPTTSATASSHLLRPFTPPLYEKKERSRG